MSLTTTDLQAIEEVVHRHVSRSVGSLAQATAAGFNQLHEHLAHIDGRLERLENETAGLRGSILGLARRLSRIEGIVDPHNKYPFDPLSDTDQTFSDFFEKFKD